MDINVFFTGLMLICLEGQSDCVKHNYARNTAWVVQANGPARVCGWVSREETTPTVRFPKVAATGSRLSCEDDGAFTTCALPEGDICVRLDNELPQPPVYLERLPRLEVIDRRFIKLNDTALMDPAYAPTKIHFPTGKATTGDLWPRQDNPTRWYRSNGDADEALPRVFSDRLKIIYAGATTLTLRYCADQDTELLVLRPKDSVDVVFQNFTKGQPVPDQDDEHIHESLAYLLWYYRLGNWDTRLGYCPDYTRIKKDAVLLQCVSKRDTGCAYDPTAQRDSTFWPPMLGPKP